MSECGWFADGVCRKEEAEHDALKRTCHNVSAGRHFECSECGVMVAVLTHYTTKGTEEGNEAVWQHARFCPNCGAEVVSE